MAKVAFENVRLLRLFLFSFELVECRARHHPPHLAEAVETVKEFVGTDEDI